MRRRSATEGDTNLGDFIEDKSVVSASELVIPRATSPTRPRRILVDAHAARGEDRPDALRHRAEGSECTLEQVGQEYGRHPGAHSPDRGQGARQAAPAEPLAPAEDAHRQLIRRGYARCNRAAYALVTPAPSRRRAVALDGAAALGGRSTGAGSASRCAVRVCAALPCPARRFARDTGGHITNGPSIVDERVIGQRDAAGNIHVDPNAKGCPYVPHHHR